MTEKVLIENVCSKMIKKETNISVKKISSPADIISVISEIEEYKNADREIFSILMLDIKFNINKLSIISIGTLDSSLVHPREVFKPAILVSAKAIILVHNHPSGNPYPSHADVEITERLWKVGMIIGIDVIDHIIKGDSLNYFSFKENSFMNYKDFKF